MKVALITGAARGIGAATARAFAQAGYAVVALDVLVDDLGRVVESIKAEGHEALGLVADLASLDKLEAAVERVAAKWGRIDVLVNNGAARDLKSIRQITPEAWNRIISTNLTAPAFLMKWVEPHMRPAGGGVMINVASVEAHIPKGVAAAYAAAKGGLLSLTYDAASALAGARIRVLAVSPGAVDTDIGRYFDPDSESDDSELDQEIRNASEELIPMHRWAEPEEIAEVILWLAGDGASYITGTEITVDGGLIHTWMPRHLKNRIQPGQFE
ncbi:MAG: SDR family oxidoreductase [Rhodothermales bacterium]